MKTCELKKAYTAKQIAKKYNISEKEANKLLIIGQAVEFEHTDCPKEADRIASHHIYKEGMEYYPKLKAMESRLDEGGTIKKSKKINPLIDELQKKDIELINIEKEYQLLVEGNSEKEMQIKSEIDELKKEHQKILYAGISENDKIKNLFDCAYTMPDELIHNINRLFKEINKSPYSCSVYSDEKTWSYTAPNSYSVADHWNFYSRGNYHKLTTSPTVEEVIKKYPNIKDSEDKYQRIDTNDFWFLAKFIEGEKSYDESFNDGAAETIGAWVIMDVFKKDYEKAEKSRNLFDLINKKQNELSSLTPYIYQYKINELQRDIKLIKYLIDNNYKSFDDFNKKQTILLKQEYAKTLESLMQKINGGLVIGSVTKKEWGGSRGHFRLISENTYSGSLIGITPKTISIKTKSDDYYTGQDYSIDTDNLTEKEKAILYGYEICNSILYDFMGSEGIGFLTNKKYKVCYSKTFKL